MKTSRFRQSHSSLRMYQFRFQFLSVEDCSPRAKSLYTAQEHFCKNFNHALSGYNLVCLVKPRMTRKEELQEAARQKVAATLAQSNVRNRLYGGQSTEGRKVSRPRRPRETSTSKPAPVKGIEFEGAKTMVKPATSAASDQQEGKCCHFVPLLVHPSLPSPPLLLSHYLRSPFRYFLASFGWYFVFCQVSTFNTSQIEGWFFFSNLSGELLTFWTNVTPPSTVHQYGVSYGKGHTIQKRYRGPSEISSTDSNQSTPRLKPRKKPVKTGARSVNELSVSGIAVRPTKQAAGVRRSWSYGTCNWLIALRRHLCEVIGHQRTRNYMIRPGLNYKV